MNKKLTRRPIGLVVVAMAACAIAISGCCQPKPTYSVIVVGQTNAIFNPKTSPVEFACNERSDWPVTYLPDITGEEVQYHEQILDIQGRGFNQNDDFLIRRFDSHKFGRTRR